MIQSKQERTRERDRERERRKKLLCLNPSGDAATPLINYEKTEVVWRGLSVCLAALEEPG